MLTRTTSTVLSRRTSSLTLRLRRRLSGVPQASQSPSVYVNAKPRFPLEIVETIFSFVLSSCPCDSKSSIIPLSCTSKAFREIALRLYYRELVVDSRALIGKLWLFLSTESERCGTNAFRWVRSLFAPSHIVSPRAGFLESFTNLRTLEVCFAAEGPSTQDTLVDLLLDPFIHSASGINLTKLAFTGIPRIDAKLLAYIAKTFPQLTTMELTSTERADFDCCLPCLEDSLLSTRHSPIPDHYLTAEKLATSFADALAPLGRLENLYLGIYLSDACIFEKHIAHAEDPRGGRGILNDLSSCPACEGSLKESQEREHVAATIIANALPSLIMTRWDTLFAPGLLRKSTKNEGDKDGFYFRDDGVPVTDLRPPYTSTFIVASRGGQKFVRVVNPTAS